MGSEPGGGELGLHLTGLKGLLRGWMEVRGRG